MPKVSILTLVVPLLAATVVLPGCASKSDLDALRNELMETQSMARSADQNATEAASQAAAAAAEARVAAAEARRAAEQATRAAEAAEAASEKADRILQESLRK